MKAKRVVVNQTIDLGRDAGLTALGKARDDVNRTCHDCGMEIETIGCRLYKVPFLSNLIGVWKNLRMILRHPRGTEYVVQYPVSCKKSFPLVIRLQHLFGNRVTILIHDIQSVRYHRDPRADVAVFRLTDRIIAHTLAMKAWIEQQGVKTPIVYTQLFDYYTDDHFRPIEDLKRRKQEIVYAGNLTKSEFLEPLQKTDFGPLMFHLYGKSDGKDFTSKNVRYCGIFQSNHTSTVEGGWGLVWDGPSIDTCMGDLGDYLHLIASHKLSLYLTIGIPVIVWKESAEAEFVVSNGLGIAVASLKELPERIASISDEEYSQMLDRCREQGKILRRGGRLKAIL